MIVKIKNLIKKIIFKFIKPDTQYIFNSYSQAGEDSIISFLLSNAGLSNISYLELGTSYPDHLNNTYKFYLAGSRGVLVEADSTLIPLIREKRPGDKILNVGIGSESKTEADFFIFKIQALNTFSKEEAAYREKNGSYKIIDTIKVRLSTINKIIRENFEKYPDFLSIDIEGLDLEVLKTLEFTKYPIPIICAETCGYSENHIKEKNKDVIDLLINNGYFVYADTYINTIFVNEKWFCSIKK